MADTTLLSVRGLAVCYGEKEALRHIDFDLKQGEYVGLIGPNGAGKSTLLKAILGLISVSKGKITAPKKSRIGYVPQHFLLAPSVPISVDEVLQMGFSRLGFWQQEKERQASLQALQAVGFDESWLSKSFASLSGGQKQRVIIARALVGRPELLLFDEPFSGVDYATKIRIYDLLAELNQKKGITILFVSHEVDAVISKCERILCLDKTLHVGCHPVHFAKGEIDTKHMIKAGKNLTPIHHHCHPDDH